MIKTLCGILQMLLKIYIKIFTNFDDLEDLYAKSVSKLKFVTFFIIFREFYVLNFAGNPIFCDCNLLNLREEAGTTLTDTGHIVCAGPPENFHLRVIHLSFEDCCF